MTQNNSSPPAGNQGAESELEGRRSQQQDNPPFRACDCPEAELVWALLAGEAPAPDTAGWRALFDLAEAIALRKLAAIRPLLVASDMDASITNRYVERTRITSVEPCGSCGAQVELVHPLPREQYDLLPDLTWVRCERCSSRREEVLRGVA